MADVLAGWLPRTTTLNQQPSFVRTFLSVYCEPTNHLTFIMADHYSTNPSSRRYEIVDTDISIISDPGGLDGNKNLATGSGSNNTEDHHPPSTHGDASVIIDPEAKKCNDKHAAGGVSNNINDNHPLLPPPPTLPSGQIIDGKNTLQSFDHLNAGHNVNNVNKNGKEEKGQQRATADATNRAIVAASNEHETSVEAQQNHLTLPNGEIMNAKNTNQVYNVEIGNVNHSNVHPTTAVASNNLDNGPNENLNNNDNSNYNDSAFPMNENTGETNNTNLPTVHAFAVSSMQLVEAEPIARATRSITFWFINSLVVFLAMISVGVGVYCGTGNCTSKSGNNSTSSDDVGNSTSDDDVGNSTSSMITMILLEFINNITFSNEDITESGTNPESQAVAWMLKNVEQFNVTALNSLTNNTANFRVQQIYPLVTMWFQQTETRRWNNERGWLNVSDECNWYGISCQAIDLGDGIGMQNVVTKIDFYRELADNNYFGTIPPDLGLLSMLEHFNLNSNDATGSLPESIGQWTALTYFDAAGNALIGTLPQSIGQWNFLKHFFVFRNKLTGTLPESIGQWTELISFGAYVNELTGTLPESIGKWTTLTYFNVDYNELKGTLPESTGQWTALTYFDVNDNALTGTLPESIGQWTTLEHFDAAENALIGTLPESIGNWIELTGLFIEINELNGTLPESIGNWSQIQAATFRNNSFTGTVPTGLCPYIMAKNGKLEADCESEVNCSCCTECY
jgi:hypothetical protein